jgi:hypothetical protein
VDADAGGVARARGEVRQEETVGVPLNGDVGVGQVAGEFGGRGCGGGRPRKACAVRGGVACGVGDCGGFKLLDVMVCIAPGEVDGHELLLA